MSENEKTTQGKTEVAAAKTSKASEKKAKKAKSEKAGKPGIGQRLSGFFRSLKAELKKVTWPSKQETIKKTGIVIACVVVVGIIVWIFDGLAGAVINALLSLFGH